MRRWDAATPAPPPWGAPGRTAGGGPAAVAGLITLITLGRWLVKRALDAGADAFVRKDADPLVVLAKLSGRARAHDDFLTDDPTRQWPVAVEEVHARLVEVERTLRVVAVAYKQAWWSLEPVRGVSTSET